MTAVRRGSSALALVAWALPDACYGITPPPPGRHSALPVSCAHPILFYVLFYRIRGIDATKGWKNSLERRNIHLEEESRRNCSKVTLRILQMLLCSPLPSRTVCRSCTHNLKERDKVQTFKTDNSRKFDSHLSSASRRGLGGVMASSVWTFAPGERGVWWTTRLYCPFLKPPSLSKLCIGMVILPDIRKVFFGNIYVSDIDKLINEMQPFLGTCLGICYLKKERIRKLTKMGKK